MSDEQKVEATESPVVRAECADCGADFAAGHLCPVVTCACAKRVLRGESWRWCGEQHCPVLDFLDGQNVWGHKALDTDGPAVSKL